MWKPNEYCSFTTTWGCDHDPSYLASYSFAQDGMDSNQESSTYEDDVPSSSSLVCSRPEEDSQPMELSCSCKPHHTVGIVGAVIASEARTVECYSASDGYLKSVRGTMVSRKQTQLEEIETQENEIKLYLSVVRFDGKLNELTLKFLGLGDKTTFTITRLELVLMHVDEQSRRQLAGIDLAKVKGYLDDMGGNIPEGGMDLLKSVEQYQQTQLSGLGSFQAMLTSLSPHQAGHKPSTGLSALLSMMPGTRPVTQSLDHTTASQNTAHKSNDSSESVCDQSSRLGPLQSLMMAMSGAGSSGESHTDTAEENKDSMFEMLRGICGKVSEMRVDKTQPSSDVTDDQNSEDNDIQSESAQDKDSAEMLPGVASANLNVLKSVFEQTAAQLVQASEERLISYIDTRLSAMETRISNKLDNMMQALQKNGHPVTTESSQSE